jgi:hypothetical protein
MGYAEKSCKESFKRRDRTGARASSQIHFCYLSNDGETEPLFVSKVR